MIILYFTGTGNSLQVAKTIGGTLYSIPELIKENKYSFKDNEIGIVFPCYYYGMPHIVEEFLKKAKLEAEYVFVITTLGYEAGDTTLSVAELLEKNGVHVDYQNQIQMIDNFSPFYNVNNELKTKSDETIQSNIEKIKIDVLNHENNNPNSIESSVKRGFSSFVRNHLISPRGDFLLHVNDNCTRCLLCVKSCPVENISIRNDKIKFNHKCEMCLRCLHICPQNAIHVTGEKSTKQFINPHISKNELLER